MATGDSEGRTPGGDSRPTPDPTTLTTEQLDRAIASLKELVINKIADTATLLESQIQCVKEVADQKFSGVGDQFVLIERGRVEQKADTKEAVNAALIAQKDAVREQTAAFALATAKSEAATAKQLELLATASTTAIQGSNAILYDVKERVGRIEERRVTGQQSNAAVYAIGGFIIAFVLAAIAVASFAGGAIPK